MVGDYVPGSDKKFNAWSEKLVSKILADPAALHIAPKEADDLKAFFAAWQSAYSTHIKIRDDAVLATHYKNKARGQMQWLERKLSQRIVFHHVTTPEELLELGLHLQWFHKPPRPRRKGGTNV